MRTNPDGRRLDSSFVGSAAHKELLCRFLIDTHVPYQPAALDWPALDEPARARLAALPIWDEAMRIESTTALIVQTMGETVKDTLIAEAIRLQGFEEARHAQMITEITRRYGIPVRPFTPRPPARPDWAFMRVGYGECFDSFFAFGLFSLARNSGLMPPALIDLFEPVMQEEGRHIIFHVNWMAYTQARLRFASRPAYIFRRALAVWLQLVSRCKTLLRIKNKGDRAGRNFTHTVHNAFNSISPAAFVTLCMAENQRRLSLYDPRLLRPTFVPAMARAALPALSEQRPASPAPP